VEIVWLDASIDVTHEGSLTNPADADGFGGLVQCRDVGYLIRADREELVLAVGLVEADNSYRHANTIDRKRVLEIVYLSRPPETEAIADDPPVD
jgi:hypothetical protein